MTGRDPAFAASPSSQSSLSRPDGLQSGVGFTPGPWAVDDMHTCSVWSGDDDPIKVAETKGVRQADCYRKADDAEREANARLIAAAPELYEALADMLRDSDIMQTDGVDSEEHDAVRERARATLAKARGEAA